MLNSRARQRAIFLAVAIALVAVLAGAIVIRELDGLTRDSAAPANPAMATADDAFRAEFLPLVERAATAARLLVVTGETRERNHLLVRGRQAAMLESLAAADAWLETNPPPVALVPAATAYREGADSIRAAMDEAQAGFLRFDFDRVARATEKVSEGEAALQLAASGLDAGDFSPPDP